MNKIKLSSCALVIAFLWIIVAVLSIIGMIIALHTNTSFLPVLLLLLIITCAGAMFGSINLFNVYKDFLTLTGNSIIVNNGLIFKKNVINLSGIKNVKHNKYHMTFYMIDGTVKGVSLLFIGNSGRLSLYRFITSNSIKIDT